MIGRDDLELAYAVVHRMGSDQSISFTQPLLGRGHRHNTEPPVATPVYKIGDNEYGDDQQLGNLRQWHLRKPDYLGDVLIPMLRQ